MSSCLNGRPDTLAALALAARCALAGKALPNNKLGRLTEKLEHLKASVRAKVEHPFHVIKNLFRHCKTRYRGLAKNTAQLFTLFAFANLVLAGRRFTITESRSPS